MKKKVNGKYITFIEGSPHWPLTISVRLFFKKPRMKCWFNESRNNTDPWFMYYRNKIFKFPNFWKGVLNIQKFEYWYRENKILDSFDPFTQFDEIMTLYTLTKEDE